MTNCMEEGKRIIQQLSLPFAANEIEWIVQTATRNNKGIQLLVTPYIDARAVMDRLDTVCGSFWSTKYNDIISSGEVAYQCELAVKIGDEWIPRTDAAESTSIASVKGGHSNALKRAAVQWGIGRYLYSLPQYWVSYNTQKGQHKVFGKYKIKNEQEYLNGYFDAPFLPGWALPPNANQQSLQRGSHHNTQGIPEQTQQNNQEQQTTPPSTQNNQQNMGQHNQNRTMPEQKTGEQINHDKSVRLVTKLLESLQVPKEYVPLLLKKVCSVNLPYSQTTISNLGVFYHALLAVETYAKKCSEYALDEDRMLYYAQIVVKVKLKNVYSLVGVMTKEDCTKALDIIADDLSQTRVG